MSGSSGPIPSTGTTRTRAEPPGRATALSSGAQARPAAWAHAGHMRIATGVLLTAVGLFLLVGAVTSTYGLLEVYADPQQGVAANVEPFLAPLVLALLVGLVSLVGGVSLLAPSRVTAAVAALAVLASLGGCWVAAEWGIDAKERELSAVVS